MKKNQVNFFDKNLFFDLIKISGVIGTILGLLVVFDYKKIWHFIIIACIILGLVIYNFIAVYRANHLDRISLKINESKVNIYYGDIFEQKGFKVIPFNEYFDTIVDDEIISRKSLNGIYINEYCPVSINQLNQNISNDNRVKDATNRLNPNRVKGNKKKYHIGTIHKKKDYFLAAFSKFDDQNRANILMREYVEFFGRFWDNIDQLYNNTSVSIPLIGSDITRRSDFKEAPHQELLEVIIWTFNISRVTISEPQELNIVLHENEKNHINLFKIKKRWIQKI